MQPSFRKKAALVIALAVIVRLAFVIAVDTPRLNVAQQAGSIKSVLLVSVNGNSH